ncbi:MAG: (cytosine-5)-methyltransferase 1 [Acidobacteriota bacterium]|jgi:DNA (cytosine-5)-methyltransferase 1|nr:(cytosine-5)-methyltransferase 1 [Acidobacteriota bacterium]
MIAIDFFCGAGGLTRGLLNAGVDVILGIDADEDCRQTYETNNHTSQFLLADIRTLRVEVIANRIADIDPEDLLFAACAPCQPFAQLNRNYTKDEAARLLNKFARFVREFQPRQVFVENVPGLARVRGSSTHRRFRKMLNELGYEYWEGVLDAKAYGVPQTRRRFVMIAIRGVEPTIPPPTHGPGLLPYETVERAIREYPPIEAGEIHPDVPNHRAAVLKPINLERIRHTPHDGGDRTAWPEHLWLQCHGNGYTGHTDSYGRMRWQHPAPTLTCKCHSLSNGRYGHPEQDRAISLREAASLQSFNDTFIFHAHTQGHLASQIGNAVPVRLAEAVGRHIRNLVGEEL